LLNLTQFCHNLPTNYARAVVLNQGDKPHQGGRNIFSGGFKLIRTLQHGKFHQ